MSGHRSTRDYCDGVEGLIDAAPTGLSGRVVYEVFVTRTGPMDGTDRRQRGTLADTLEAVLDRLVREGRIRLMPPRAPGDTDTRWITPRHADALEGAAA